MYIVLCDSCDESEVFESLSAAQDSFNEHASDKHLVELQRIPSRNDDG